MDPITQREAHAVLKQLQAILSSAASVIQAPSSKYPLIYSTTGNHSNAMTGIITLQEDMLCSMEVLIKTTKMSPMIKASFREDKQWKLQQVQDAVNHLKQATNAVTLFVNCHDLDKTSPDSVSYLLDSITNSLNACRARLFSPCKLSMESLVSSGIVKMFTPSLPRETIVNLFILEDRLIMMHYTVQQSHTILSKNYRHTRTPLLFHPVGMLMEHGGTRYEVATAHKAECHIPWLTEILDATELSLELCYELQNKLTWAKRQ